MEVCFRDTSSCPSSGRKNLYLMPQTSQEYRSKIKILVIKNSLLFVLKLIC
ncbi:hypothetical protein GMA19_02439 [Paenibacillus polymyxa E681]|nr:hypothetical protein GE561_02439 [Paenibacillus polymyxa E681]QNV62106.1 hypothetical protein GMA19_02439 [Paenibacillus polymyxa E681]